MLSGVRQDIRRVRHEDPAARSTLEIVLCYPGLQAVWVHRISHWLWQHNAKLPARFLAELMRKWTGVEIHPGAGAQNGKIVIHYFSLDDFDRVTRILKK